MPLKGWKSITISEDVYNLMKEYVEKVNRNKKVKVIRSSSHLVELAIIDYVERKEKEA